MDESLPIMLRQLRLPAFNEHHQRMAQMATEKAWDYGHYLAQLCEQEIAQRYESRVRTWSREAKLPAGKSFATLDVTALPAAIQKKVIALRENTQWVNQNENVLLIGPSGAGSYCTPRYVIEDPKISGARSCARGCHRCRIRQRRAQE